MTTSSPNQTTVTREKRGLVLDNVLTYAPTIGIDEALAKYGSSLTSAEQEKLRTLTIQEFSALKSARDKLGSITQTSADNNHNYY